MSAPEETVVRGRIPDPAEVLVCAIDEYGDVLHWGGRLTAEMGLHPVDVVGRSLASVLADRVAAGEILETIRAHGSWRGLVDLRPSAGSQGPSIFLELDAVHSMMAVGVGVPISAISSAATAAPEAFHDRLTGVGTRALLDDRLDLALARLGRRDGVVAVYSVLVHHLEEINHVHGHLTGDAVLIDVAERLAAVVRAEDTVVRYGGDEFVVVCDLEAEHQVDTVARRLVGAVPDDGPHVALGVGSAIARRVDPAASESPRTVHELLAAAKRDLSP